MYEEMLYSWGARGTVANIVAILAHHEIEHVEEIRATRLVKKTPPAVLLEADQETVKTDSTLETQPHPISAQSANSGTDEEEETIKTEEMLELPSQSPASGAKGQDTVQPAGSPANDQACENDLK